MPKFVFTTLVCTCEGCEDLVNQYLYDSMEMPDERCPYMINNVNYIHVISQRSAIIHEEHILAEKDKTHCLIIFSYQNYKPTKNTKENFLKKWDEKLKKWPQFSQLPLFFLFVHIHQAEKEQENLEQKSNMEEDQKFDFSAPTIHQKAISYQKLSQKLFVILCDRQRLRQAKKLIYRVALIQTYCIWENKSLERFHVQQIQEQDCIKINFKPKSTQLPQEIIQRVKKQPIKKKGGCCGCFG